MRVLAASPHLDDAAFSVGGTLAALADAGHDVTVVTVFTASVPAPTGFALACQTDKGLGPQVDYMALRRREDERAQAVLGTAHRHLPLPEAPHRGYASAAELFAGVRDGDDAWREVVQALEPLEADLWLAPQGIGHHVDHEHVVRAVAALARPTGWWPDVPYVLRHPGAPPSRWLPTGLSPAGLAPPAGRRSRACACYATQLGFQFGSVEAVQAALADVPEVLALDAAAAEALSAVPGLVQPLPPGPDGAVGTVFDPLRGGR